MKPVILTFGEIIWDVYKDARHIGGAAFNFASHVHKCGADSVLLSAVGGDALGDDAISSARSFGIDASFIRRTDKKTGQCLVNLDEHKVPAFTVLSDAAYDNITLSDADIEAIRRLHPAALYFGTLIQRAPVSEQTLKKLVRAVDFPDVVCDVNLRKDCYTVDSARFCLENATILKISDEEEPLLRKMGLYASDGSPENVVRALSEAFPRLKLILLTCGERGAYAYSAQSGELFHAPAEKITPVSTVGAGDSFIAAFTALFLRGEPIRHALECAVGLSAYVVSCADAVPPYDGEKFPWIPKN